MKRKFVFALPIVLLFSAFYFIAPTKASAGVKTIWGVLTGNKQDISTFSSALLQGAQDAAMRPLCGMSAEDIVVKANNHKNPDFGSPVGVNKDGILTGGAAGYLAVAGKGLDSIMKDPPLSIKFYAYDVASHLPGNLVTPPAAYALDFNPIVSITDFQNGLFTFFFRETVLNTWKVTRNIAYAVIVMLLVFVGFMIMFRKKIAPQVVVSVTNALPKLVLGIILITFSYPIAALAIPIMSALNNIVITVINSAHIASSEAESVFSLASGVFDWLLPLALSLAIPGVNLFTGFLILAVIASTLVVGAAIVFTAISRLVKIILAAIFGPLILAIGIIPGNESLTSDWFKGLIINTISVPAMLAVYFFGFSFIKPSEGIAAQLMGAEGGLQTLMAQILRWFLAVSIMWYAKNVPTAIASAFKAPPAWVPGVSPKGKR